MRYRVTGGSLNVRQEPNTNAPIRHILADGEEITADKAKDGWCRFGSGYVMAKWLEEVPEDETAPVVEDDPAVDINSDPEEDQTPAEEKPKKTTRKSNKKTTTK